MSECQPAVRAPYPQSLFALATRVYLDWERLRIAYLVVLTAVTLVMTGTHRLFENRVLATVVEGALVANFLFLFGPTVETISRWLFRYQSDAPRWWMFVSGTLLAILLATVSLNDALVPPQN